MKLVVDVAGAAWGAYHARTDASGDSAFDRLRGKLRALALPGDDVVLACDAPPYLRRALAPSYKAHRDAEPAGREAVRGFVAGLAALGYTLARSAGHEADDVCATYAARATAEQPVVIASADKDLWCLVGRPHVTVVDLDGVPVTVERVRHRWGVDPSQLPDLLALAGDSADEIAGVPSIGAGKPGEPGRAAILLREYGTLDALLAEAPAAPDDLKQRRRDLDAKTRRAKAMPGGEERTAAFALCAEAQRKLDVARYHAQVCAHRETVDLARRLVALRDDVPLDVAAKGESDGLEHGHEADGRDRLDDEGQREERDGATEGARGADQRLGERGLRQPRRGDGAGSGVRPGAAEALPGPLTDSQAAPSSRGAGAETRPAPSPVPHGEGVAEGCGCDALANPPTWCGNPAHRNVPAPAGRCACPATAARACYRIRYNLDTDDGNTEWCTCSCHEDEERDDEPGADPLPAACPPEPPRCRLCQERAPAHVSGCELEHQRPRPSAAKPEPKEKPVNDRIPEAEIEQPYADPPTAAPLAVRPPEPSNAMEVQRPREIARQRPEAPPAQPQTPPMMSEETGLLFRALARAQMEFGEVKKTRAMTVRGEVRYHYANLSDVVNAVMPSLRKHGFACTHIARGNRLHVRLIHVESEQWIEGVLPFVAPTVNGPEGVQALGSLLTYLRRYLLSMLLGVVAVDDDDDGDSAMHSAQRGGRAA